MPSTAEDFRITIIIATIIFFSLVAFILFLVFMFQARKRKANAQLEKEILNAQIEIQEQTFKTISQEIHDNIVQLLTLAKLNLATIAGDENEPVNIKVNDSKILVGKAINDLRNLSRSLYGDRVSEIGLTQAIDVELKLLQNTGQYYTSLQTFGDPFILDPKKEVVLFRMVQETLNNIIKHAKAKSIAVQINNFQNKFNILISDDGAGFDEASLDPTKKGMGLKNLQNRAALINGKLSLKSSPGNGTKVEITVNK